ncbi:hypothetical protein EDD86DRAFT_213427 [Gorgonomyces haynaldii]|nr:hypothetical protein EDD86DRAFT_213427 [Gorgonomyces haynaldii]
MKVTVQVAEIDRLVQLVQETPERAVEIVQEWAESVKPAEVKILPPAKQTKIVKEEHREMHLMCDHVLGSNPPLKASGCFETLIKLLQNHKDPQKRRIREKNTMVQQSIVNIKNALDLLYFLGVKKQAIQFEQWFVFKDDLPFVEEHIKILEKYRHLALAKKSEILTVKEEQLKQQMERERTLKLIEMDRLERLQ